MNKNFKVALSTEQLLVAAQKQCEETLARGLRMKKFVKYVESQIKLKEKIVNNPTATMYEKADAAIYINKANEFVFKMETLKLEPLRDEYRRASASIQVLGKQLWESKAQLSINFDGAKPAPANDYQILINRLEQMEKDEKMLIEGINSLNQYAQINRSTDPKDAAEAEHEAERKDRELQLLQDNIAALVQEIKTKQR